MYLCRYVNTLWNPQHGNLNWQARLYGLVNQHSRNAAGHQTRDCAGHLSPGAYGDGWTLENPMSIGNLAAIVLRGRTPQNLRCIWQYYCK